MDEALLERCVTSFPGIDFLLADLPRIPVKFDAHYAAPEPLTDEVRDLVIGDVTGYMASLRPAMTAYYRRVGRLGARGRLPRLELEVVPAQEVSGGLAYIEGELTATWVHAEVRVMEAWWAQIGSQGLSMMGGRFVLGVEERDSAGRPGRVRAAALLWDAAGEGMVEALRAGEEARFETAEVGAHSFEVSWSDGVATLTAVSEGELGRGRVLA
jgi:hypothetical protein